MGKDRNFIGRIPPRSLTPELEPFALADYTPSLSLVLRIGHRGEPKASGCSRAGLFIAGAIAANPRLLGSWEILKGLEVNAIRKIYLRLVFPKCILTSDNYHFTWYNS